MRQLRQKKPSSYATRRGWTLLLHCLRGFYNDIIDDHLGGLRVGPSYCSPLSGPAGSSAKILVHTTDHELPVFHGHGLRPEHTPHTNYAHYDSFNVPRRHTNRRRHSATYHTTSATVCRRTRSQSGMPTQDNSARTVNYCGHAYLQPVCARHGTTDTPLFADRHSHKLAGDPESRKWILPTSALLSSTRLSMQLLQLPTYWLCLHLLLISHVFSLLHGHLSWTFCGLHPVWHRSTMPLLCETNQGRGIALVSWQRSHKTRQACLHSELGVCRTK